MATYTKNGPNVTNTYGGYTVTWYCKQVAEITVTATTVDVVLNVYAHFVNSAHIYAGDCNAALVVDNNVVNRANPQSDNWPSDNEDWHLISRRITYTRGTTAVSHTVSSYVQVTGGAWEGTSSTYNDKLTINVPALQSWTVSFSASGGSGAPSAQTKYYGKTLTLSSTRPTRTGFTFKGWGTSDSTTTVTYNPGGAYTSNAAAKLYAVWQRNSYVLAFNATGGEVNPSSRSVAFDAAYGTLPAPTKTGYRFTGWYTAATGGSAVSAVTKMGAANTTIYAHWERAYVAPTVTIIEARRDSDQHNHDDSGTVPYVKFEWAAGDDSGTPVVPSTYDIVLTEQVETSPDIVSITGRTITTSPIEVYFDTVDPTKTIDTEKSYDVEVTLHITGHTDVSAADYISQAYFIMDINADGTAIGIGMAVEDTDEGFFCSMPAEFSNDINIGDGKKYKINGEALSPYDIGEADYVTHRGTSGAWAYRKWKNGKVEAWATITLASATPSAWSSPVRIIDQNDNAIPSGIFSSAPNMIASAAGNQYWMGGIWATASTKYNVRICTCATAAQAPVIKIYAWTN